MAPTAPPDAYVSALVWLSLQPLRDIWNIVFSDGQRKRMMADETYYIGWSVASFIELVGHLRALGTPIRMILGTREYDAFV